VHSSLGYRTPDEIEGIFRDWLRAHHEERRLYAQAKHTAAAHTLAAGGNIEAYNAHKQTVIRQIYARAFTTLGLT